MLKDSTADLQQVHKPHFISRGVSTRAELYIPLSHPADAPTYSCVSEFGRVGFREVQSKHLMYEPWICMRVTGASFYTLLTLLLVSIYNVYFLHNRHCDFTFVGGNIVCLKMTNIEVTNIMEPDHHANPEFKCINDPCNIKGLISQIRFLVSIINLLFQ